jgi:hypothetical protein
MTKNDACQGPGNKSYGKRSKGGKRTDQWVFSREKYMSKDQCGRCGINIKIVELYCCANEGTEGGFFA